MSNIPNYYEYGAEGADVRSLVVMLHGVGSNGQDLISLAPLMAPKLPGVKFVSPDAPFACDMVPQGYPDSYQWFSLQSRDPQDLLTGVQNAFPLVEDFLEGLTQRFNVPYSKLVLLGFSQGTMTSLYTAPRLKESIAGVLGYSGALIWEKETKKEDLKYMPIRLIHGQADDVVPPKSWGAATETLKEYGYDVDGHITPRLTHSIDQKGIDSGLSFLKKVLA